MKKVLIIEVGGSHTENLYSLICLFKEQNLAVSLSCNESLFKLFPNNNEFEQSLLLPDDLSFRKQIFHFWKIRKFIQKNKFEAVDIGTTESTLTRNLSFFLPLNITYTGIIHNAKKLEKGSTIEKIVFRKVKKFIVLSNYLLNNITPLKKYRVAAFLPIYFPRVRVNEGLKKDNEIFITIPGLVENKRRDYLSFFNTLKQYQYNKQVKIILLGKLGNEADFPFFDLLNSLNEWKNNIVYFNEYLNYETFHGYIALTDYLLPLIKTEEDSFYGNFRISGTFNLGLGYHKPFLLPNTYKENFDINAYSIFYNSYNRLFDLLINNVNNELQNETQIIQNSYKKAYFNNTEKVSKNLVDFIVA